MKDRSRIIRAFEELHRHATVQILPCQVVARVNELFAGENRDKVCRSETNQVRN